MEDTKRIPDGGMIKKRTELEKEFVYLFSENYGRNFWIYKKVFSVGRSAECDLILPNSYISQIHTYFVFDGTNWFVRDNHSTNGTLLNGERLLPEKKYLLHLGDIIVLAKTEKFVFHKADEMNVKFKEDINFHQTFCHLKYDQDGNIYSDFDFAVISPISSKRAVQCHKCGFFIVSDSRAIECPECKYMMMNEQRGLYVDPVVFSEAYKMIEKELEAMIDKEFPPENYRFGDCHGIWHRKKQILLERYHIRWRTPSEMNPDVVFD